jgi:Kef-type K+ transport system membrane component KefB
MGRIPGFSKAIFPPVSLSYLNLVSTIGLILFLFLVGLEVDISVIRRDWRSGLAISTAGMVLPFALGAAIAVAIYHEFINTETVSFGHFLLFSGVAMSITAFPVLCRILSETKLLETKVGQIVLSAGVGNDVVGWVLLALTIALVNASTGVTAVYILLCSVAWTILILWPVKRAFLWLCRRSGSFEGEHGPTPGVMIIMLMLVFISAFYTGIIGELIGQRGVVGWWFRIRPVFSDDFVSQAFMSSLELSSSVLSSRINMVSLERQQKSWMISSH